MMRMNGLSRDLNICRLGRVVLMGKHASMSRPPQRCPDKYQQS